MLVSYDAAGNDFLKKDVYEWTAERMEGDEYQEERMTGRMAERGSGEEGNK